MVCLKKYLQIEISLNGKIAHTCGQSLNDVTKLFDRIKTQTKKNW